MSDSLPILVRDITAIIAEETAIPVDTLQSATPLSSLNVDSFSLVGILFTLEERYGVSFGAIEALTDIGSIAHELQRLKGGDHE